MSRHWVTGSGRASDPGQRGVTLVELMIAMVVSSLLIALILGVQVRMSTAYHGQGKIAEMGKTLRGARGRLIADLRQAGFMMPQGFTTAAFGAPDVFVPPIDIVNDAGSGSDQFTVYFADPGATARVLTVDPAARQFAELTEASEFAIGDLIVMVNPVLVGGNATTASVARYDACLAKVTGLDDAAVPVRIEIAATADGVPFNTADNAQCAAVATATTNEGAASETVAYRLASRTYRISPDDPVAGLLQVTNAVPATDGGWEVLATGVVNLQLATRFREEGDLVDLDVDGDPERDWYSGDGQETEDPSGERPVGAVPTQVSLSLEVRSPQAVQGALATTSTKLTDDSDAPASIQHNMLGDWAAVDLTAASSTRPIAYRDTYLYRASTTMVDLRNVGIGR